MALDTGSVPCDLLNNAAILPASTSTAFAGTVTSFEDVWLPASATVTEGLGIIFQSGITMKKFSEILTTARLHSGNAGNTGKMLKTLDPSSKYRLISFLSDGGVAVPVVSGQRDQATAAQRATLATALANQQALPASSDAAARAAADTAVLNARVAAGETIAPVTSYSILSNILYTNSSKYLSIVDDLFVGSASITGLTPTGGTVGTPFSGLGKSTAYTFSGDSGFTAFTDTELKDLVTKLQTANYLLKREDLYPVAAVNPTTANSTALISLFQLVAQGTDLSATQKNSLYELQTRNLRFFASFLAEYCFYRTRYDWFLKQYFKYYTMSGTDFTADSNTTRFYTAFSLVGTNQTQPKLLQEIATQMAKLNTRMVDMKKLLNAINQSYQTIFTNVQTTINSGGASIIGSNANVVAATQALSSSAESAEKYLSDAEFRKGIMDYTSEKNRYSNILLSFYAFLNIAALAAIFQLARS
jgi:hypothetical protein